MSLTQSRYYCCRCDAERSGRTDGKTVYCASCGNNVGTYFEA